MSTTKRWPLNKAYFWEMAPFFRPLLPFAAGIACYERLHMGVAGSILIFTTALLAYTILVYNKKLRHINQPAIFILTHLLMFAGGVSISYFNDNRNDRDWFGKQVNSTNSYLVRIKTEPVEKEKSWKLVVSNISTITNGHVQAVEGDAFVYVNKDDLPMTLHKGDSIILPGNWQPIKNAGNPFEFDYAGYCRRNNVQYQQNCAMQYIRLYATNNPDKTSLTERTHDWCMQQLDKYIPDATAKGLIQAMLIGDEVNLDEDLKQAYAETGIIHIIAISGGNVIIFFTVISALLWWLRDKKHVWIKYAIALPLVWFYVLMAGAPPSAVRAAIMFSLLAFAVMLQKNNSSLNSLFGTAFILLCAEPMWLFSVGFQLSFVAVLSLILFYTPIYKWVAPVNKLARWVWGAIAASIAAEILVAPLVIYYFHTFPLLFLVANVAAFVFMSIVLVLGMALVVVSILPAVAKVTGIVIVFLVTHFDSIVYRLQGVNPESFHLLVLTGVELAIVYAQITALSLFLMKKEKNGLLAAMAACCLLVFCFCCDEWVKLTQQRIVVYNAGKVSHTELITGESYTVLHTDASNAKKIKYTVSPAHINWQTCKERKADGNEVFIIGGKKVLVLNEDINSMGSFPVDYVLVNYAGKVDARKIDRIFSPKTIVPGNSYTGQQENAITNSGSFVIE